MEICRILFSLDANILLYILGYCCGVEASEDSSLNVSSSGVVGVNDLLIVGPGVLGRIIAKMWQQVITYSTLYHFFSLNNIGQYRSVIFLSWYCFSYTFS